MSASGIQIGNPARCEAAKAEKYLKAAGRRGDRAERSPSENGFNFARGRRTDDCLADRCTVNDLVRRDWERRAALRRPGERIEASAGHVALFGFPHL